MAQDPHPTTAAPKAVLLLCSSGNDSRVIANNLRQHAAKNAVRLEFVPTSIDSDDEGSVPLAEYDRFSLIVAGCDNTFQALSKIRRRKDAFKTTLCGIDFNHDPKVAFDLIVKNA